MPRAVVFAPHFIGQEPEKGSVGSLGPGAYEGLRVSLRRKRQRDYSKPVKVTEQMVWNEKRQRFDWREVRRYSYRRDEYDPILVKVTGLYSVYCGQGWEHSVRIDQSECVCPGEPLWEHTYRAWKERDREAAVDLAAELVEYQLEDWWDPCDEIPDECPLCGFDLANNDFPTTHNDDAGNECSYIVAL